MRRIVSAVPLSLAAGLLLAVAAPSPVHAQEQQFADLGTCAVESGEVIDECRIGYRTMGELNAAGDNAILVPTWYGGTTETWVGLLSALLGEDHDYFVVLLDALGNGVSISPSNSETQPGEAFPDFTTRDMVHAHYRVATEVLGLEGAHAVMGISMGGMQTFEWGVLYPDFMAHLVPIAGSPLLGSHDVALWEAYKGLFRWNVRCQCDEAAETMAAVQMLNSTTSDQTEIARDAVFSSIRGSATNRMDPGMADNLIAQADAMIATDVTLGFDGDWDAAAAAVQAPILIIVGSSDHVVTPGPAVEFAGHLGEKATLVVMENGCGHNIPGCEMERAGSLIQEFLASRR